MDIRLDRGARYIIEKLNSHGKRADIVGGCVRDFLLGKEPFDFDITTEASPDEMKEIFSSDRVIETGIKHGTLTVLYEGTPYEVTTYREDGEYLDHRHPTDVKFTKNIEGDLSRRDFTVNAICYNERDGLTDLFGGIDDINKKIIRAVGDPYKRFDEDALRILRAIRFSATLGFSIEHKTAEAARALSVHLESISAERIYAEWQKLIAGCDAYSVIAEYPDIIGKIIGFLPVLPDESTFASAEPLIRILSLFATRKSAVQDYKKYCERLHTDSKTARVGIAVLENLDRPLSTQKDVLFSLRDIGYTETDNLIRLKILRGELDTSSREILDNVINEKHPYTVSMLDIDGSDIMSLGLRGKEVGAMLSALLEKAILGKVANSREELIELTKKLHG